MKAFIEILREKYGLAQPEAEKLLEQMELLTYRKGEHIVREGERNSSFYLVADGIWRGHYLRDGVDISLWFAFQGDSIFSSWGYVAGLPSLVSIEAMSDSRVYRISKSKLETFFSSSVLFANIGRVIFERQFLDMENWMINGRCCTSQTALPDTPGAKTGIIAARTAEAHRFLFIYHTSVAQSYTGRTEQEEITV